jgi:hypothetical protein
MRHFSTFRGVYLAADAAIRARRARDQEESQPEPTEGELSNEPASTDDLVAIVEQWCGDLSPQECEEFFDKLKYLSGTWLQEQGVDSARRGAAGASRARGAGDFNDRAQRPRYAGDSALRGIKSAHERFADSSASRVTVMG